MLIKDFKQLLAPAKDSNNKDSIFEILKNSPYAITDINGCASFLRSNLGNETKYNILCSVKTFIDEKDKKRKHIKDYKVDFLELYDTWEYKSIITFNVFVSIYLSMCSFEITEYTNNKRVFDLLNYLSRISNNSNMKINILFDIYNEIINSKVLDVNKIATKYSGNRNIKDTINTVTDIFRCLKKDLRGIMLDAVSALTIDNCNNNVFLENNPIYSILSERIVEIKNDKALTVFVINPNVLFCQKLCKDKFYINTNVVFVFQDEYIPIILSKTISHSERHFFVDIYSIDKYFEYYTVDNSMTLTFSVNNTMSIDDTNSVLRLISRNSHYERCHLYYDIDSKATDNQLFNNYQLQRVYLFPSGIKNETVPKYKTLVEFVSNEYSVLEIEIYNYYLQTITNKVYLLLNPRYHSVSSNMCRRESFRALFKKQDNEYLRITSKTRNTAKEMMFSRYIKIFYTIDSKGKVKAYTKSLDNKIIQESIKYYRSKSLDDALSWVKCNYVFEFSNSDTENNRIILEVLLENIGESLTEEILDINTLLVLYPEVYTDLNIKEKEVIKDIIKYDIGMMILNDICHESLETIFEDNNINDENRLDYVNTISSILDFSKSKGIIAENKIKKILEELNNIAAASRIMRDNLLQRSLTVSQYREAYNECIKEIHKGNTDYIGVLIKLFMPIQFDCICAIELCDIHRKSIFKNTEPILYFDIYRRIVKDSYGKYVFKELRSAEEYRKVVVPSLIVEEIERYIDGITNSCNHNNTNHINLVSGEVIDELNQNYMNPSKLSKLCRNLLKKIKTDTEIIRYLDSESKEYVEDDVSDYKGDFFRSNLKYYIISEDKCNFDENEMNYYFGIKQYRTFAKHYVDYENEYSLFIQHLKLKNLERIITPSADLSGRYKCINKDIYIREGNEQAKYMTILRLKGKKRITINNNSGLDLLIYGEKEKGETK